MTRKWQLASLVPCFKVCREVVSSGQATPASCVPEPWEADHSKQDITYIWGEGSGPLHPIGPRNFLVTVTLNPKLSVDLKTAEGDSWQALPEAWLAAAMVRRSHWAVGRALWPEGSFLCSLWTST